MSPDHGRFIGRRDFEGLLREALARAARDGWPEMIWSDATFADWPLRERAVVDSLQAWASSGRRLTLIAARYDEVLPGRVHRVIYERMVEDTEAEVPERAWSATLRRGENRPANP